MGAAVGFEKWVFDETVSLILAASFSLLLHILILEKLGRIARLKFRHSGHVLILWVAFLYYSATHRLHRDLLFHPFKIIRVSVARAISSARKHVNRLSAATSTLQEPHLAPAKYARRYHQACRARLPDHLRCRSNWLVHRPSQGPPLGRFTSHARICVFCWLHLSARRVRWRCRSLRKLSAGPYRDAHGRIHYASQSRRWCRKWAISQPLSKVADVVT